MQAGKRNHRLIVEERVASSATAQAWADGAWSDGAWAADAWASSTEATDGYTWAEFTTVWAERHPLSAREFLNVGDQILSRAEGFFKILATDGIGIDATKRLRDGSVVYNIIGALEDNKSGREWITLPYSRGTNEG